MNITTNIAIEKGRVEENGSTLLVKAISKNTIDTIFVSNIFTYQEFSILEKFLIERGFTENNQFLEIKVEKSSFNKIIEDNIVYNLNHPSHIDIVRGDF